MKDNVYDLISDFYENDESWNMVIPQNQIEGYLRKEAWRNLNEESLEKKWDQLLILMLFLGKNDVFLRDLRKNDFVDLISWCVRNISDFKAEYSYLKNFLDTLEGFLEYLASLNILKNVEELKLAQIDLLGENETVLLINSKGEFWPYVPKRVRKFQEVLSPKIFLNLYSNMIGVLKDLRKFYKKQEYLLDVKKALYLYGKVFFKQNNLEDRSNEEIQDFWDYFFFDYKLLKNDKTPTENFLEEANSEYLDIAEELSKARFVMFNIVSIESEGVYRCKDIFTGEEYVLDLMIDESMVLDDVVFLGHLFYRETRLLNSLHCVFVKEFFQKKLKRSLESCYEYFKIQEPDATRGDFVRRNSILVRRLVHLYASAKLISDFSYKKKLSFKRKKEPKEDEVTNLIKEMMKSAHFSAHDIKLTKSIWSDYRDKAELKEIRQPQIWAASAIANYIELNNIYELNIVQIADMCWQVPVESLKISKEIIKSNLFLIPCDPRYCNEEGFMKVIFP